MTLWQVVAYLACGWAIVSVGFVGGCWWAGARRAADDVVRIAAARRRAVTEVISALNATQTHGGDCDAAFRTMAAIVLDQQVELVAYRNYAATLEGERLAAEAEEWANGGGS